VRRAPETATVLIAGGGPVGLTAALRLALSGVKVEVFEQHTVLPKDQRASTVHPPTLDMLDELGIVGDMINRGLISPNWQYRDHESGPVGRFELSLLSADSQHPYRVSCAQWKISEILLARLRKLSQVKLHFGAEVVSVQQTDRGVSATIARHDGSAATANEQVHGDWLLACDGIRSRVREQLGIALEGMTIPERYWVISTYFDYADVLPELDYINYVSGVDRWYVMVRGRNYWRVLFPMDDSLSDEELAQPESEQRALASVYAADSYLVAHRKLYRAHQRVATRMRAGRVLLAGDSAHQNSPLGGMGMNGGMHDAFAACNALLEVMRGADEAVLDRYSRQRCWVARNAVQAHAARNEQLMRERDPAVRASRLDEMRRVAGDTVQARQFLLRSSMIQGLRDAAAIP
jgi:3-(3-hydroxy-phenyl)propionate hydroxylase